MVKQNIQNIDPDISLSIMLLGTKIGIEENPEVMIIED